MEPQIQYAQTEDGVSIAYTTMGEGSPLVHTPMLWSHLQMDWQIRGFRRWHERLAREKKVVRYDRRASGLSERNVTDYSLDAFVLDLEAVVDRLGLERFALMGILFSGPVAVAYAARHPGRVSRLILWGTYARGSDYSEARPVQAFRSLLDKDWEIYSESAAQYLLGWSAGEEARPIAAFLRESSTPQAFQATVEAMSGFDVTSLLSQVRAPTLVLHRREADYPELDVARRLASGIPDARLAVLEGSGLMPLVGDVGEVEAVASAIDEFLGEGEEAAAPTAAPSGLVTILFTDMESSTALTQRLGDANAQELVRAHNTIVREALSASGGTEIKHTGDGIMASFPSASGALECAVAIQRAVKEQEDTPLRVRIGLNAGEPVAEEEDLFGASVQLAKRVCDHAEPGQIVASNVVRELATGKGFLFSDLGDVVPKGFEDPVRLYEVRWQEEG